jgi:hypothetical protein
MKCAYFENRSTTVRITERPWTLGSPSMKSMEMSAQTWEGTSRGCSRPASWNVWVWLCWHVTHVCTWSWTRRLSCGM